MTIKEGLWSNIHAKRKSGKPPAKKGDKSYPKTLDIGEGMKTARKNVGADSCWKGYTADGTKKKDGKEVPNCVKETKSFSSFCDEAYASSVRLGESRISALRKYTSIEDYEGNTAFEITNLIEPDPMTGWKQQVNVGESAESNNKKHATALYKDQWKDRKIADYDKSVGRDGRAKEMRADAGEDRDRMWGMDGKWKHAKYSTGEKKGKKNVKEDKEGHAIALYKDQWKDRKIADYDKSVGKDERAKEMRADAGEDRKRMKKLDPKWKHAKYSTGEVKGKKNVEEGADWIGKAIKKPGALRAELGVPEGEKIPKSKLDAAAKKGGKLGQRARLAKTLSKMN